MTTRDLPAVHPGHHLAEFLGELEIDPGRAAADLHIPASRIEAVLCGADRITADLALRLGRYFGGSVASGAAFWMSVQSMYDRNRLAPYPGEPVVATIRCPRATAGATPAALGDAGG